MPHSNAEKAPRAQSHGGSLNSGRLGGATASLDKPTGRHDQLAKAPIVATVQKMPRAQLRISIKIAAE